MKGTLQAYLISGDGPRLAGALDELALRAPKGYSSWESTARVGARAARIGDLALAKAQCKACHEEHRARFREEMRSERLF